ncbi:hypothetical protein [Olleya sp. HaHaR_3_96]|uniref:hypothetical protein n=1 Tax=Olleya sp. HaHaR_3_96 TaxID=2745560 RepID=UPI001C4F3EBF|nr:hypothetical protein [Olleya sp. HaHaR_3_96]QXP58496.1 hypothetical protein H0I26_11250 [Olleya sp. HaHaR_3_96]
MTKPTGIITAKEAVELSDAWTKLRQDANNTAAGQEDNRSSWFSIDDMEAFIKMIKEENPFVNGVRCYLGVNQISKINPNGLTTVLMVPTESKGGKNQDIIDANGMDRGDAGMPPGQGYPN